MIRLDMQAWRSSTGKEKKICRTFFSYIGVKESKLFLDFIMLALKHLSIMFNQLSLALGLS